MLAACCPVLLPPSAAEHKDRKNEKLFAEPAAQKIHRTGKRNRHLVFFGMPTTLQDHRDYRKRDRQYNGCVIVSKTGDDEKNGRADEQRHSDDMNYQVAAI